ncbi:MAG: hypothetical protein ACT4PT_02580 [Methanobacteriota archaeon]
MPATLRQTTRPAETTEVVVESSRRTFYGTVGIVASGSLAVAFLLAAAGAFRPLFGSSGALLDFEDALGFAVVGIAILAIVLAILVFTLGTSLRRIHRATQAVASRSPAAPTPAGPDTSAVEAVIERRFAAIRAEVSERLSTKTNGGHEALRTEVRQTVSGVSSQLQGVKSGLAKVEKEVASERQSLVELRERIERRSEELAAVLDERSAGARAHVEARATTLATERTGTREELRALAEDVKRTSARAAAAAETERVELSRAREAFSASTRAAETERAAIRRDAEALRSELLATKAEVEAGLRAATVAAAAHEKTLEGLRTELSARAEEVAAAARREHEALSEFARRQGETLTLERNEIELMKAEVARGLGELREEIRRQRIAVDEARAAFESLRGKIEDEIRAMAVKAETALGDIQEHFEKNLGKLLQDAESEVEGLSTWLHREREKLELEMKDTIQILEAGIDSEKKRLAAETDTLKRALRDEIAAMKTEIDLERTNIRKDFDNLSSIRAGIESDRTENQKAFAAGLADLREELAAEISRAKAEAVNTRLAKALDETLERSKFYTTLGVFLLGGLGLALVLGLAGVGSPGLFAIRTAFFVAGLAILVLAVSVVVLLFALGDAFRRIRRHVG